MILAAAGIAAVSSGTAATLVGNPDTYAGLVKRLRPGDTLTLAPGIYRADLVLHDTRGTAQRPIVISGDQGHGSVFLGQPGHNTVSLANAAYIEIHNLVLDGQGLAVDAVKAEGPSRWAHHITLDNLVIYGYGEDQQIVGISTKCPAWNWVVRDNVIYGAGTGMYFGSSDGSAPFIDGIIEGNVVMDSVGYDMEIKYQKPWPTLPLDVHRPGVTLIRRNVFSKVHGGAVGHMARPNVLVGHWPSSGPGRDDTYLIYGNFFYQNPTERLFQGEGNIALYDNLFVNYVGDAVAIIHHRAAPRRIDVFDNTVVARGLGIAVRRGDPAFPQRVVGNAVFAAIPLMGGEAVDNVTGAYAVAGKYLNNPFGTVSDAAIKRVKRIRLRVRWTLLLAHGEGPDSASVKRIAAALAQLEQVPAGADSRPLDLYPRPGRLSAAPVPPFRHPHVTDADVDFNGTPRKGRYRGAYAGEGHNAGWAPRVDRITGG